MDNKQLLIPRRLDDPPKVFFWEFDVAMVFSIGLMFGIVFDAVLTGCIAGILAAGWFGKAKGGNQKGYARHLFYWHMPVTMGFKRTPSSAERDFIG